MVQLYVKQRRRILYRPVINTCSTVTGLDHSGWLSKIKIDLYKKDDDDDDNDNNISAVMCRYDLTNITVDMIERKKNDLIVFMMMMEMSKIITKKT